MMMMMPYQSWICLIFGYAQLARLVHTKPAVRSTWNIYFCPVLTVECENEGNTHSISSALLISYAAAAAEYKILVFNIPLPDFCTTNSSECLARRNMQQDVNDFSRILTRLNTSTHALLDSLITGLLNEDTTIPPESQQQILFPDIYDHSNIQTVRIEKPPACAKSLSFCEEIDSYPHKHLDTVLKRTSIERDFFGTDEVPEKEFANRLGYSEQDIICASRETTIFPKVALNKNNKWKYVINQGENEKYIQGIRIETCLKPNSPCYIFGDVPVGYTLFCKQKYILRRLLSVSDTGQPVADSFRIPSACCCSVKKDLDFLTNFGRNASPSMKPTR